MSPSSVKARTAVLRVSGLRVCPWDFVAQLNVCSLGIADLSALGTVGNPYIWQMTFHTMQHCQRFVDVGDFSINSHQIEVMLLTDCQFSCVLHSVPFWVDHRAIMLALQDVIPGSGFRIVRLARREKGFEGLFDTKVRIFSCYDLKVLPHFLDIVSDNTTVRALVIVPDRPPLCLKCEEVGHMSAVCTKSVSFAASGVVVSDHVSTSSLPTLVESVSPSVSISHSESPCASPSGTDLGGLSDCDEVFDLRAPFKISRTRFKMPEVKTKR